MNASRHPNACWPLPLAITVLFLFAVHAAYALSIHAGYVPACVPYLEGCVSISRAARHGMGNVLFKALVIPCALLHAAVWWLSARGLSQGTTAITSVVWMRWLGLISALALAVYATYLGSEGPVYGFLRRYGVTVYFGFGFVAQLLLLRIARRQHAIDARLWRIMAAVCAAMLLLGVVNVAAGIIVSDDDAKDRIENALEWQLGLLMVGWYALLSLAWKRVGRPSGPTADSNVTVGPEGPPT